MRIPILFFLSFVVSLTGKVCTKQCSNSVGEKNIAPQALFIVISSCIACIFFFISGGFHIAVNLETLIFACLFAMVCSVSVLTSLVAYRLATIAGVNIIAGACSTVCSTLIGSVIFHEILDGRRIFRLLLLICACVLVALNVLQKEKAKEEATGKMRKRQNVRFAVVLVLFVLVGCSNTFLSKAFVQSKTVTDENSYFFVTNLIMVLVGAAVFGIRAITNRQEAKEAVYLLQPKQLLTISVSTITSNLSALIGIWLMAMVDIAVYSPVSQALGVLSAVAASWLFREKQGVLLWAAAALACISVIL